LGLIKDRGWLLCRFGGIGDGLILTSICEAIKYKDPKAIVHFAIREGQEELYHHNPNIDKVITIRRMPPSGVDCVKIRGIWASIDVIKPKYFRAIDYKNSVENNSMYPHLPYGFWVRTQNSNYQNWIDLSLGWANIDPEEIPPEIKRPKIYLKKSERDWAREILGEAELKIGVHMISSSLARTWYYASILPPLISEKYKNSIVIFWTGKSWVKFRRGRRVEELKNINLRRAAALISQLDLLIASDSAFTHVAEAVGTRSLNLYTTVPAWTRAKYYKYATCLQAKVPCSPCFAIWSECPYAEKKALESLNEREKQILDLQRRKVLFETACRLMNTNPQGLNLEFEAIIKKIEGLKRTEAPCLRSIKPDEVLLKVDEILGLKKKERGLCSIITIDSGNGYLPTLRKSIRENTHFPYELIVVKQAGRTLAQNYNLGFKRSKGEYILFMNDDTVVFDGWLTRMIDRLEATGAGALNPGGAFGGIRLRDARKEYEKRKEDFTLQRRKNLSGFCLLTKREILDKVGLWDENYEHYFEDTDLTMRIGEEHMLFEASDIFVWHRKGGSTKVTPELIAKVDRSQKRWEEKFGTQLPYRMADNLTK